MKKIAILQSNYLPWKGYFDMIAAVDEFILYDDMQFTKNDWRNRNRIKTPKGLEWVSIPVGSVISRKIKEVTLPDNAWREKHIKAFELNYRRAKCYEEVMAILVPVYNDSSILTLTELNKTLIEIVCRYLGIYTKISYSWDYELKGGKIERLVNLSKQANASIYVSGPAAKDYLQLDPFNQENISVEWFDYSGYAEYPQLWGQFEHGVTVLDLLFNCGKDAPRHMKYVCP
jgi:hypothetical protein